MRRCFCCHRRMISRLERHQIVPFRWWPGWLAGRMNCGGECWRCMVNIERPMMNAAERALYLHESDRTYRSIPQREEDA